jgi:hypothetical protein
MTGASVEAISWRHEVNQIMLIVYGRTNEPVLKYKLTQERSALLR